MPIYHFVLVYHTHTEKKKKSFCLQEEFFQKPFPLIGLSNIVHLTMPLSNLYFPPPPQTGFPSRKSAKTAPPTYAMIPSALVRWCLSSALPCGAVSRWGRAHAHQGPLPPQALALRLIICITSCIAFDTFEY